MRLFATISLILLTLYSKSSTSEFVTAYPNNQFYHKIISQSKKIIEEGWKVGNVKHGWWKYYSSNGILIKEGAFFEDKKSGFWIIYNSNGSKQSEGYYYDGLKSGYWTYYDSDKTI